jgi:hypothetical protein
VLGIEDYYLWGFEVGGYDVLAEEELGHTWDLVVEQDERLPAGHIDVTQRPLSLFAKVDKPSLLPPTQKALKERTSPIRDSHPKQSLANPLHLNIESQSLRLHLKLLILLAILLIRIHFNEACLACGGTEGGEFEEVSLGAVLLGGAGNGGQVAGQALAF